MPVSDGRTYEDGLRDALAICRTTVDAMADSGRPALSGRVCFTLIERKIVEGGPVIHVRVNAECDDRVIAAAAEKARRTTPEELERTARVLRERAAAAAAAAGEAHQRAIEEAERQRQASDARDAWGAEQRRVDAERKSRRRITVMEAYRAKERLREPILSGVTPQTTVAYAFFEASVRLCWRLSLLGVSDGATLRELAAIRVSKFIGKNCGKGTLGEMRQMLSSAGLWLAGDEEIDMRDEQ